MTQILFSPKNYQTKHLFVITENYQNDFEFIDKVNDYFKAYINNKENNSLIYNYLGKLVTIIKIDSKEPSNILHEKVRKHGAKIANELNKLKQTEILIVNQSSDKTLSLSAAEGLYLGNYQFINHLSKKEKVKNSLKHIYISAEKQISIKHINELNITCDATCKARDLVNEPVNFLNAKALSNAFKLMGKEAGFSVDVLNKSRIKHLKMGGLLAVNAGSVDEPTFNVMTYKPSKALNKKPIILVGKGVVYDTGGLSLKPTPNSMDSMKCDMAGAAAVGCAIYAIAKMKLNVHVIALVPATDNRPGYNAFAPGDIIEMMDGSTVEMLNSDAEGRMILADALHYAKQFKPELVIDIATLTGSAMAALGSNATAGMGNAEGILKTKLITSSFKVHERIAELPFWDDYNDLLKSDIADQKNIGGSLAGAITAGKFLEKFTDYPYYHLDIAGPAFLSAKDGYRPKGGTGVGVRLFIDFFKSI
ncbi:MAG: leucyl aminopeptidase [Bacteroidetes bacterium]|nr:leucyl aminopeptidase [Bacteroidota bacterium]